MNKPKQCLAMVVTIASLFIVNTNSFATKTDDYIESAAKQSYVFKTYLKSDDVKIESKDGAVTLTGTVSE